MLSSISIWGITTFSLTSTPYWTLSQPNSRINSKAMDPPDIKPVINPSFEYVPLNAKRIVLFKYSEIFTFPSFFSVSASLIFSMEKQIRSAKKHRRILRYLRMENKSVFQCCRGYQLKWTLLDMIYCLYDSNYARYFGMFRIFRKAHVWIIF